MGNPETEEMRMILIAVLKIVEIALVIVVPYLVGKWTSLPYFICPADGVVGTWLWGAGVLVTLTLGTMMVVVLLILITRSQVFESWTDCNRRLIDWLLRKRK